MTILNIAIKELESGIKTKRFYGILVLFGALTALYTRVMYNFALLSLSKAFVTPFQHLFFSAVEQPFVYSLTLIALLLGVTSINSEIEKGTIKILYSKPIYRDTILLGKFVGGFLILAISVGIFYLIAIGLALIVGVPITGYDATRLLTIYILSILYGLAIYSLGMLFSTLIKSQRNGIIAGIVLFLVFVIVIPMIIAPIVAFVIAGPPNFASDSTEWLEKYSSTILMIDSLTPVYHYQEIMNMVYGQKPQEEIMEQLPLLMENETEFKVVEERPIIEGFKMCLNNIVAVLVTLFVSLGLSYYKFANMDLR